MVYFYSFGKGNKQEK